MISNVEHIKVFTRVRKNIFLTLVGALNAKIEIDNCSVRNQSNKNFSQTKI